MGDHNEDDIDIISW